tara:strand:- start:684 stop:1385 length:702 start_codon:yes stop_codon:yes gene_type:complete
MLKIRCSAIGNIMTNARSKNEILSKTTKSYLQELAIENYFGRRKYFTSKYTEKGNEVEEESIRLCEEVLQKGFLYKNEEKLENDYIKGIPDVNTSNVLIDVKSSWDIFSFPHFDKKLNNKAYYYQLMGYMWLTGKSSAYLCYCLVNTPQNKIEDEIRREHWKQFEIDENPEIRAHVEKLHLYNDIDNNLKVKLFKIEYDEKVIESIKNRIDECRVYYDELINELNLKLIVDAE